MFLIQFIKNRWINFLWNNILNIVIHFNLSVNTINLRNIFPELWHPFCSQFSFSNNNRTILNFKCYFSSSKICICLRFPWSLIVKVYINIWRYCFNKIKIYDTIFIVNLSKNRFTFISTHNFTHTIICLNFCSVNWNRNSTDGHFCFKTSLSEWRFCWTWLPWCL
jgi:hypothetical protein